MPMQTDKFILFDPPFAADIIISSVENSNRGRIQPLTAGNDPTLTFQLLSGSTLTDTWTLGTDDSDSDKFKIESAATLGSSPEFSMDTSGNATISNQLLIKSPGAASLIGTPTLGVLLDATTSYVSTNMLAGGTALTLQSNVNSVNNAVGVRFVNWNAQGAIGLIYTASRKGDLVFGVADGTAGSDPAVIPEVMRITGDGNTGYGTTSPQGKLHVNGRLHLTELTSTPAASDLTSGGNALDRVGIFMKNDKLAVAYNSGGTVWYATLALDTAATNWVQTTTVP